ncbi:unnamed protein product [Effrenium voratum]|uniref:Uncharacterized protein n=1 Tax=Effrenium voratum TaxID=2562239 RepID=A0AA36JAX7_9DINO|nr:unnamed protein product [Effrenium voratum]
MLGPRLPPEDEFPEADCAACARDAAEYLPSEEVDCAACARDAADYLPSPTEEVDCAACARDAADYLPSPTEEAESYAADGFGDAAWPNASDDAADAYEEDAAATGRSTRSVPAESSRSRASPQQDWSTASPATCRIASIRRLSLFEVLRLMRWPGGAHGQSEVLLVLTRRPHAEPLGALRGTSCRWCKEKEKGKMPVVHALGPHDVPQEPTCRRRRAATRALHRQGQHPRRRSSRNSRAFWHALPRPETKLAKVERANELLKKKVGEMESLRTRLAKMSEPGGSEDCSLIPEPCDGQLNELKELHELQRVSESRLRGDSQSSVTPTAELVLLQQGHRLQVGHKRALRIPWGGLERGYGEGGGWLLLPDHLLPHPGADDLLLPSKGHLWLQ